MTIKFYIPSIVNINIDGEDIWNGRREDAIKEMVRNQQEWVYTSKDKWILLKSTGRDENPLNFSVAASGNFTTTVIDPKKIGPFVWKLAPGVTVDKKTLELLEADAINGTSLLLSPNVSNGWAVGHEPSNKIFHFEYRENRRMINYIRACYGCQTKEVPWVPHYIM